MFFAIIVYRKHINISFPSGAALADPEGLLHGKGTRVRHLKVKLLGDLQTAPARGLLEEARKRAAEAVDISHRGSKVGPGVSTVIKRRAPGATRRR